MDQATCNHEPRRFSNGCPDGCLIAAARLGDEVAYGRLFHRHYNRARHYAGRLGLTIADAEDVVAQAFAATCLRLQRGGGPDNEFLAYLRVAIRNTRVQVIRHKHARVILVPTADIELARQEPESIDDAADTADGPEAADHYLALWSAFTSLSGRWRQVLWSTEVEGMSARQLAPELGLSANAVAALSMRARRGLRIALASASAA